MRLTRPRRRWATSGWLLLSQAVVLASSLGSPARAVAQDSTGAQRLVMHVAADDGVVASIRERLGSRLSQLGVRLDLVVVTTVNVDRVLEVVADTAPGAPLARAWLDGRVAEAATLFLMPANTERIVARRINLGRGFDEVALAEVVYVVERSMASLLAFQPVGVPKTEVRAALTAPAVPRPPSESPPAAGAATGRLSFQVAALAGLSAWSSHHPVVPEVAVTALIERQGEKAQLGIWLMGQLRRSLLVETPDADLAITGGSAQLMLVAGRRFGALGTGRVALGPGLTFTGIQPAPITSPTKTIAVHSRSDVDLLFRAALRWDFTIIRRLTLVTAATIDAIPARGQYTSVVDGNRTVLISPWPIQPTLFLGVALALP